MFGSCFVVIRPSVFRQVADFANVFKAFIGTNWIGLPFAFKQSGIVVRTHANLFINPFTPDSAESKIDKCFKSTNSVKFENKLHHSKVRLDGFPINGHGFCP